MFRLLSGLLLLGVVVDETRKQFCLFLLFLWISLCLHFKLDFLKRRLKKCVVALAHLNTPKHPNIRTSHAFFFALGPSFDADFQPGGTSVF